jgi:hypothetical protein
MKNCKLIALAFLCHSLAGYGHVVNGFLPKKMELERKIDQLIKLTQQGYDQDFKKLHAQIRNLEREYKRNLAAYQETENLILEVKEIDPALFDRVSEVTNAEGGITDVFVKYVGEGAEEVTDLLWDNNKAVAYTTAGKIKGKENICWSTFGMNTLSIVIVKGCDAPIALAHEFGHILYLVPNFNSYTNFFKSLTDTNSFEMGHNPYDPSYQVIKAVENEFKDKYNSYSNRTVNKAKNKNYFATVRRNE